jgi:uncharacterized protein (TIGR03085 family)
MTASSTTRGRVTIARLERQRLCDLMAERGPLAPTLCEGWTAADLAAHLYVRESKPWVAIGIVVPRLSALPERAMERVKGAIGFDGLVERIRSGPSVFYRPVDAQVNGGEYFVHHEDLRRAGPDALPPREDAELDAFAWTAVRRMAKLSARKFRAGGLELVAPGFGSLTARKGAPLVTMTGGPQELLLYLFGRKSAALVEISGPDAAVEALGETTFGF